MPDETYEVSKEEAQVMHIEELLKHDKGLTLKLQVAETEIGKLHLVIDRLEDGQLALTVKLDDASSELGRLSMVLKHRTAALELLRQNLPAEPQ